MSNFFVSCLTTRMTNFAIFLYWLSYSHEGLWKIISSSLIHAIYFKFLEWTIPSLGLNMEELLIPQISCCRFPPHSNPAQLMHCLITLPVCDPAVITPGDAVGRQSGMRNGRLGSGLGVPTHIAVGAIIRWSHHELMAVCHGSVRSRRFFCSTISACSCWHWMCTVTSSRLEQSSR